VNRNHFYIALAILFVVVILLACFLSFWTLWNTYQNPSSPQFIDS